MVGPFWKTSLWSLILLNAAYSPPGWAKDVTRRPQNADTIPASYGPGAGDPACVKDPSDPFDPAYKITYGDYNGKCIDSSTVRPPIVLSQDDRQITIANFYHQGRFWLATIPKDAVSTVYFQGVPFGSVAFGLIQFKHGQFRFKLNQPIQLHEQAGHQTEVASLDDLIISATATHPPGVAYSVTEGGNFGIATRVLSPTARAVEEISEDQSRIHQYEVSLSAKKKSEFLVNAITDGAKAGYQEIYSLFARNCTTVLFDSLDNTIPRAEGVEPFRGHWYLIHDEIEGPALEALKERRIPFTSVQDMNEEITCAKPGETLGNQVVKKEMLGAASALCQFNSALPRLPN